MAGDVDRESDWPRGDIENHRCRSLVEEPFDEIYERVRIVKACPGVEAGDQKEFPVALDTPIYPSRPNILASSPPSDLDSCHANPFVSVEGTLGRGLSSDALLSVDHDCDHDSPGTDP